MKAAAPGAGFLFRIMLSAMTAFLVMSVMSLAVGHVASDASGGTTGGITGSVIQLASGANYMYFLAQAAVGVITFLGSFYVLSKSR